MVSEICESLKIPRDNSATLLCHHAKIEWAFAENNRVPMFDDLAPRLTSYHLCGTAARCRLYTLHGQLSSRLGLWWLARRLAQLRLHAKRRFYILKAQDASRL